MVKKLRNSVIVVLLFLFSSTLFAQNPTFTWEKKGWQKGINAAATYSVEGKNYLVMSNPTNGNAWVFSLGNDGKVGGMTWGTKKWQKGINAIATYEAEGKNYLVMSNPTNGNAWVFSLGNDGKVGGMTWGTKKWQKGISAITTYEAEGNNYLVMSNPTNGIAWIFGLGNDGKVGGMTWGTKKWHKGISAINASKPYTQDFLMLSAPDDGKAWTFELEADGKIGELVWKTSSWDKGINCFTNYETEGNCYELMVNQTNGRAWMIERNPMASDIKIDSTTGDESKKLVDNIDKTFYEIHKTNLRVKSINDKLRTAHNVLEKTKTVSNSIGDINSKVTRTSDALNIFKKIPIIGIPINVIAAGLNQVEGKLKKANLAVQKIEKTTLGPTLSSAKNMDETMRSLEQNLAALNQEVIVTKTKYSTASTCVANTNDAAVISTFEKGSAKANANLATINSTLAEINKGITEVEKIAQSITKLDKQIKPVQKSVKAINKAFKNVDKVAKEIDKVLSKKFKKQIKVLGKKIGIDISLKKVLNGGKVGKNFKKLVDTWVKKAIDPVLKKLKIKIPGINIDGFKIELNNLNSIPKEVEKQKKIITDKIAKVKELKNNLNKSFEDCLSVPPCESK